MGRRKLSPVIFFLLKHPNEVISPTKKNFWVENEMSGFGTSRQGLFEGSWNEWTMSVFITDRKRGERGGGVTPPICA